VLEQSRPLQEVFIVDDGSTESMPELPGVRVVRLGTNQGRGAARARAMQEAKFELVLACDASLRLDRNFLSLALPWFEEEKVAGVFGWVKEADLSSASNRWRGRHLFRSDMTQTLSREKTLASGCFIVRRSSAETIGGFNPALRFGEDADFGNRLRAAGYTVIFDPKLYAASLVVNGVFGVLERYARWNSPNRFGLRDYMRQISYSLKVMVAADLKAGDFPAALISLLCPHYQFWTRR
jgi:GT2 family glycosyltransferase